MDERKSFSAGNGPPSGGDSIADWYAGVENDQLLTHWWTRQ